MATTNSAVSSPTTGKGARLATLILFFTAAILWALYFTLPGIRAPLGSNSGTTPTAAQIDSVFHTCLAEFGLNDSCWKRTLPPIKKEDSLKNSYLLMLPSDVPAPVFIAHFQALLSPFAAQLTAYEKEQHRSGWMEISTGRFIKFYCDMLQGKLPRGNMQNCILLLTGTDELSEVELQALEHNAEGFTVLMQPGSGTRAAAQRFEAKGKEVVPLLAEDSPEIEYQLRGDYSAERLKAYANALLALFPGTTTSFFDSTEVFFSTPAFAQLKAYLLKKGITTIDISRAQHAPDSEGLQAVLAKVKNHSGKSLFVIMPAQAFLECGAVVATYSRKGWNFLPNRNATADTTIRQSVK